MEIYHKIEVINGKEQITLFVNYPDEYEFSLDFNKFKEKTAEVADKIREYAFKNLGTISNDTALLVLNGVVLGTLLITELTTSNKNINFPKEEIIETISDNESIVEKQKLENEGEKKENNKEENDKNIENEKDENKNNETRKEETSVDTSKSVNNTKTPTNDTTKLNSKSNANNNSNTASSISNSTASTVQTPTNASTPNTNVSNEKTINVKLASGQVITVTLEEYVLGVVGAEMPAEFQTEALKAQAVASRTYALKKMLSSSTISASISDQRYNTNAELKAKWGTSYDKYYAKIKSAVDSTKGQCLTYNGSYIEALFFSTSNGKTEDAIYVWGNSFPYLKSVDSSWDTSVSGFSQTKTIPMSQISSTLGVNLTSASDIKIVSKTTGNRVNKITICGKEYTGVKIRQIFGLRSADFDISQSGNNIVFTTRGYGHGVGMSQYGANGMAKSGYSYSQILKHYYSGVSIVTK